MTIKKLHRFLNRILLVYLALLLIILLIIPVGKVVFEKMEVRHAYSCMVGRSKGSDELVAFYGDAGWMIGEMVLIARDRTDLWEFVKKHNHFTKPIEYLEPPLKFRNLLQKLGNPNVFTYQGTTNANNVAGLWYCPKEKLICVKWIGDF